MERTSSHDSSQRAQPARQPQPGPGRLAWVVVLAASHALWSLFQWDQLVLARGGEEFFCGFGESGACAAIWDSPLASAVHRATGLPLAGWGLAWSIVAFGLPLWALVRRSRGLSAEPAWFATLLTALSGLGVVAILVGASIVEGHLCGTCAITYALVVGYGVACLGSARKIAFAPSLRGAVLAGGALVAAFLALVYPGLHTPGGSARDESALVEVAPNSEVDPLGRMISRLSPHLRQTLSDSLAAYAKSESVPLRPARFLIGPAMAAVRITVFTDALCGHCASLHETLMTLRKTLPHGAFALEPRQFPLDTACNPDASWHPDEPLRCFAARASICVEDPSLGFADAIFKNQRTLTPERVYELAAPFVSRERLKACISSPETAAKLQDDIDWALEQGIKGTPLVLVNGRKASSSPQFLYALLLAHGDPNNPAFASLPPPDPRAHFP